ncbi:hypothetical protein AC792_07775 [Arthrobacter sp. RIT-PI-e]|uniref:saccharopine dehydrogenase NADP-binding domain-containing protein n=1 Tax=Arthrobacter sp. RIT-PI-e TaxID=1681197 RepID=UPI0006761D42|nr:saccharopine dehydrogenase NADP-binding domain-containing protein [Arthrobacter sp. RIT-PI-e]KNC19167.1 hypothetical protein AC792_07775 [Arthrobacter sp. RIT-PI-e]
MSSFSGIPDASRAAREFDLVVLGATGVTGRCVLRRLAENPMPGAAGEGSSDAPLRWAAAGRDEDRVRTAAAEAGAPDAGGVAVDPAGPAPPADPARRTRPVVNLAGPYTHTAEQVIEACLAAGASYVDLSGELPLMVEVDRRFDAAARAAGIQIVQMAGWEAMPADVTTLVASRRALGDVDPRPDGPGAGGAVRDVTVSITFTRTPEGRTGLGGSVSGGTVASIVEQLGVPDARSIGDPACLLPPTGAAAMVRATSPLRVRPRLHADRVLAPAVPVPFLDPPTVHRTAALLAAEAGTEHRPASFREGVDSGTAKGPGAPSALLGAALGSALQSALLLVARSPRPLRRAVAAVIGRGAPAAGTGPTGHQLTDWEWEVRAEAFAETGGNGSATLSGTGHPGYTATAGIVLAVAAAMLGPDNGGGRSGCITPALALGVRGAEALDAPDLRLR